MTRLKYTALDFRSLGKTEEQDLTIADIAQAKFDKWLLGLPKTHARQKCEHPIFEVETFIVGASTISLKCAVCGKKAMFKE